MTWLICTRNTMDVTLWRMSFRVCYVIFSTKYLTFVQVSIIIWLVSMTYRIHVLANAILAHVATFSSSGTNVSTYIFKSKLTLVALLPSNPSYYSTSDVPPNHDLLHECKVCCNCLRLYLSQHHAAKYPLPHRQGYMVLKEFGLIM